QAEDGIRDFHVTGVQTCALPISTLTCPTRNSTLAKSSIEIFPSGLSAVLGGAAAVCAAGAAGSACVARSGLASCVASGGRCCSRSEERRVGKECRFRGSAEHLKK